MVVYILINMESVESIKRIPNLHAKQFLSFSDTRMNNSFKNWEEWYMSYLASANINCSQVFSSVALAREAWIISKSSINGD